MILCDLACSMFIPGSSDFDLADTQYNGKIQDIYRRCRFQDPQFKQMYVSTCYEEV